MGRSGPSPATAVLQPNGPFPMTPTMMLGTQGLDLEGTIVPVVVEVEAVTATAPADFADLRHLDLPATYSSADQFLGGGPRNLMVAFAPGAELSAGSFYVGVVTPARSRCIAL